MEIYKLPKSFVHCVCIGLTMIAGWMIKEHLSTNKEDRKAIRVNQIAVHAATERLIAQDDKLNTHAAIPRAHDPK